MLKLHDNVRDTVRIPLATCVNVIYIWDGVANSILIDGT